jgi:hypothetical protein
MDAKRLIDEDKATAVYKNEENSAHELNWFCLNKESFFSKEIRFSNSKLFSLHEFFSSSQSSLFFKENFGYYYSKFLYSSVHKLLLELPNQLTNSSSKFYSTSLAKSIISIQEATLSKFKEFSTQNGYRVLHANKNNAFVKGFSSLKLARSFAEESNLPQPQIVGFANKRNITFA